MKSHLRICTAWLVLCGATLHAAQASPNANTLTPQEQADGWLLLFDGQTLFGWRPAGVANWQVADGVLRVSSGEKCLLRTTTQFGNYRLKADFRAAPETHSGVFLRTSPRPQDPGRDGYELNIAPPDNPLPTGSLVQREKADAVSAAPGEWHSCEIQAEQGDFVVQIDGQVVLQYTDPAWLGRGYIGLQHNEGPIEFRNIKLKPLRLSALFNGRDLSGWVTYPDQASRFTVTETGELSVRSGRGQLESEGRYGDFVLQLDCITHGSQLNSGIFFRCQPGSEMAGYESQIHNGYLEGDRRRPADCGTGGIFRRQNARRVVSDDFAWFRKTIIADGPHMAVWVNGYQVTDWTDKRPPDPNPRRGLRLDAGTIMIQGHDPTTDLSFRRIEIGETPPRWPSN